jgi:hypothetical protein
MLSGKPLWGLIVAIVITLVSNILTVVFIQSLQNDLQSMYKEDLIGQNYIQSARIALFSLNKEISQLFLAKDQNARNVVIEKITTGKHEFESLLRKSRHLYRAKKDAALIVNVRRTFSECKTDIDTLVVLSALEQREKASGLITGPLDERFRKVDSLLESLDNYKKKHDISLFKDIDYQLTISIVFTLLTLLATIGFKAIAYWFKRPHGPGFNSFVKRMLGKVFQVG